MSGILKTYFGEKSFRNQNNSACKYLTTYNDNLRLFKSGLLLSENNILKINQKLSNSTFKNKNLIQQNKNNETYDTNYFFPQKNNNSAYEEAIFSNILSKRKTKTLKPIYNFFPNLTANKNTKLSNQNNEREKTVTFPNFKIQKKKYNEITITEYKQQNNIKKRNNIKCLTTKNDNSNDKEINAQKIVNSLIVKKDNNTSKKLHHINSSEYLKYKRKKGKFPIENSISPASYIDVNLKRFPNDKQMFKSFNIQLKSLNNKMEFRDKILKQVDENFRNRKKVENLKNPHNNEFYSDFSKKNIEELFLKNKNDNKNNLHFNLYDYYNNIHKMKVNNRTKYIIKNIGNLKKALKVDKKSINFDQRMKKAEVSTIKAVNYLKSLSLSNNKMMKEVLDIYSIFNEYEK